MESFEVRLQEARALNAVTTDTVANPFASKYKARKILVDLLTEHRKLQEERRIVEETTEEVQEDSKLCGRIGVLQSELGANYIDCEERSAGESYLNDALENLTTLDHPVELMRAYNYLGVLWSDRNEHAKAKPFLESASTTFHEWESAQGQPAASKHALWVQLNGILTHTYFYLAQVYGHLKETEKSVSYIVSTLNRQLLDGDALDHWDWSKNCQGLASYYTNRYNFRQAFYFLSASSQMLPSIPDDGVDHEKEQRLVAENHRVWGAFYSDLLKASIINLNCEANRDELKQQINEFHTRQAAKKEKEEKDQANNKKKTKKTKQEEAQDDADADIAELVHEQELILADLPPLIELNNLQFPRSSLVNDCPYVRNFNGARDVFRDGLTHLVKAVSFFVLDGFVSEHIPIQQQMSLLYKNLAQFELDAGRRCKMTKRRITLLEPIIEQINEKIYLEFYQQLTNEVARCYADLADTKLDELLATTSQIKINQLLLKAIHYHDLFRVSFHKDDAEPTDKLPASDMYHYLTSRFSIARLYAKIYHEDVKVMVTFTAKALESYKELVAFCERVQPKGFAEELDMAKEMVQLLPFKINKILQDNKSFRL